MLAAGHWLQAWREARAQRRPGRSVLRILVGQGLVPLLPDSLWRALRRLRSPDDVVFSTTPPWMARTPISPHFAATERVAERVRAKGFDPLFRPSVDTRRARLDTLTLTGGAKADIGAGYEALFGVQIRDPARDVHLVDFCLAVPEDQWLRHGQSRWLIRRAMRRRLPAEVLDNEYRGLQAADWLERLQESSERIASELERLATCDLVSTTLDVPRLRRLVAGLPNAAGSPERLFRDYRGVLDSGLMTGSFLRWFECVGRTPATPSTSRVAAR
jgi:asparagine synthase (glutamine-hydrolysing)